MQISTKIAECDSAIEQSRHKQDYFTKQLEETEASIRYEKFALHV